MRSLPLRIPLLFGLVLLAACRRPVPAPRPLEPERQGLRPRPSAALERLGHTIQAGAFAKPENAARLAERLRAAGLEATHFRGSDGLFRVRFGDFPTREAARQRAEALKREGVLEVYYLVAPEWTRPGPLPEGVRGELVKTAESFLGVPYLWGGTSVETGFDCSGLAQAVYRLNGLRLPRSSRDQYQAGTSVDLEEARPGDLLFFAMNGGSKVTHVAVYAGRGAFIHAPGSGKVIRRDVLEGPWNHQLVGVRTYL